jgi:hypothetical protein
VYKPPQRHRKGLSDVNVARVMARAATQPEARHDTFEHKRTLFRRKTTGGDHHVIALAIG